MPNTPVTIELNQIPLVTIRNLFCLDMPGIYQEGFSFEAPFTPHQMITAILRSISLETMADEFDKAGASPEKSGYEIGCISTPQGSCFAYTRYKSESGVYHLTFISAIIEQELGAKNKPVFNIAHQSIVTGIEDEDAGQTYFNPFACLCLLISDQEENMADQLIEPQNADEFYGSLCYIQQSMATCICGNELDTIRNQCWLDPLVTARAYEDFSNIVGASCIEDVAKTHLQYINMAEELLSALEEDPDTEPPQYDLPHRILN